MGEGDTLPNAAIGGAVAILTTPVLGPASPIVGGGIAGYLQRGEWTDGAVVGALSGLIALVPFLLFFGLVAVLGAAPAVGLFSVGPVAGPEGFAALGGGLFLVGLVFLFVVVAGVLSAAGFGALGGALGAYVATETDLGD